MFLFGDQSMAHLAGVHPDLVRVARRAIQISTQDFSVEEGLRTAADEAKHVADGTSHTTKSKHLVQADGFGHALDLVPVVAGKSLWTVAPALQWSFIYPVAAAVRTASIAEKVPVRWGGVWDRTLGDLGDTPDLLKTAIANYCTRHNGPDFLDGPHFELVQSS